MFRPNSLFYTDGYKIGHKSMLAPKTDFLYGTWIPRSVKYAPKGITKIVSFGQQLLVRWVNDEFKENFFNLDKDNAMQFSKDMSMYLGIDYNGDHFEELHNLGYLPIKIKSLPEGIETPAGIPHMTFVNTKPGFAWLTLYLETIISSLAWKPSTSASIALLFRRNLESWINKTAPEMKQLIPFLCHDFSARGLNPHDMLSSGLGHAISFRGSDSIICIPGARYYYNEPMNEVIINSVNASEHSVSTTCIFTMGEEKMFDYYMTQFPIGILSMVSDTFDLTKVVKPTDTGILVKLKDKILTRHNGNPMNKLVIRPDSAPDGRDPVDIICGHNDVLTDRELQADYPEFYNKGLIECLWEIFGGTVNESGYKVLHPAIGAIYGDSITPDRQVEIYRRLEEKKFASSNIVLGVGSYTYQYNTRDTFGFAAKGAHFISDGVDHNIFKDPITDGGTKKSLKGRIAVTHDMKVIEECNEEQEKSGLLQTIFEDGVLFNQTSLSEIRSRIDELAKKQ